MEIAVELQEVCDISFLGEEAVGLKMIQSPQELVDVFEILSSLESEACATASQIWQQYSTFSLTRLL